MSSNYIISTMRIFFMNLCVLYSFTAINRCKITKKNIICILLFINLLNSIIFSIINEVIKIHINNYPFYINVMSYMLNLLISVIIINKLDHGFIISMLISICFSMLFLTIATIIPFFLTRQALFRNMINSVIEYLLIGIIQFMITFHFFKIKRFKDGFSFLNDEKLTNEINELSLILIITILITIIFELSHHIFIDKIIVNIIIIAMFYMLRIIRKTITKHYKLKMKDRTVDMLNEQISEKDKEISELKQELANVHKINHKYNHRISAMENAVSKLKFNEESANENSEIIEMVENLSKEYKEELGKLNDDKNNLPQTGIVGVDNILEYMSKEAKKNFIEFELNVECDLKGLTEKIQENKLETLLADHINDAIIAIKFNENNKGKILVDFTKIEDIYHIKIYDTGIEFEIDTLPKLGLEQTTTHKSTGRKRNWIYYNI